eukprot:6249145-Prymnesium_polylepis.1
MWGMQPGHPHSHKNARVWRTVRRRGRRLCHLGEAAGSGSHFALFGALADVLRAQRERRTDTTLNTRQKLRPCAAAGRAAVRRTVLCAPTRRALQIWC